MRELLENLRSKGETIRMLLKKEYVVASVLLVFLCCNTMPVKFTAMSCYRLDLSVAVIVFASEHIFKWDKRTVMCLSLKVILSLFWENPGIEFGWHLLLCISNVLMDMLFLLLAYQCLQYEEATRQLAGICRGILYICVGVAVNVLYHTRLCAAAYGLSISDFIKMTGCYNAKVVDFWSLQMRSIAAFYFTQYVLTFVLVSILFRVFETEKGKVYYIADREE